MREFRPGDEVFGSCHPTFAEYTVGRERNLVGRPANLGLEEAAALPGAGATALQAVRDHGAVEADQRVLSNGAAGGVGTYAVQIAKALGAHVTAVCSARNVDLVRSLGADEAIDYAVADFTRSGRYDVVLDNVGNRTLRSLRRALAPDGTLVAVAGGKGGPLLGGLMRKLRVQALDRLVEDRLVTFTTRVTKDDLLVLKELVEAGRLRPVIDRRYPLAEAAEAIRHVETGHARGKVLITVAPTEA